MKPRQLPRLWCALQGLLPLEPGRPRPRPGAVRRKGSPGPDADEATRRRTAWERPEAREDWRCGGPLAGRP